MKLCPICGKDNLCKHDASCWCMKFEFLPKTKEYLAKTYVNKPCVCQECVDNLNKTL